MKIVLAVLILPLQLIQKDVSPSPKGIILEMIESAHKIEGFTAKIIKKERIRGVMIEQITKVKLKTKPFQLYLYQQFPKKGIEILVHQGANKALVNPNAFPWINLSLDPYGNLMRKNQHHTVFDSGFDLMSGILHRELARIGTDTAEHIAYKGLVEWQGRAAYLIEMSNPNYHISPYIVKLGEDLNLIARKLNLNEYTILELNEDIDFYDDVTPGQKIKVPSSYAKRMELYIDQQHKLPLVIKVYDNLGLYEEYAYKEFKLNPDFAKDEFTSDYKEYNF